MRSSLTLLVTERVENAIENSNYLETTGENHSCWSANILVNTRTPDELCLELDLSERKPPKLVPPLPKSPVSTIPTTLRPSSDDNLIEENSQDNARSIVKNDFFSEPLSDIYSRGPLGEGAFGKVYKATLKNNNVEVAVKKMREDFENADIYHEKFTQLNALNIPFLIQYICRDFQLNRTLFIFEYIPRGTLADFIDKEHGILTWNLRYKFMKQMANAMNYMHTLDYIHCDLKIENVLIDKDLSIRISDLDDVRNIQKTTLESGEKIFSIAGTTMYYAPELLRYLILPRLCRHTYTASLH